MVCKEVILVTGVGSRVGSRLAERLLEDYQVIGFDLALDKDVPGLDFVAVDFALEESVDLGLKYLCDHYGKTIASVIHLPIDNHPVQADWSYYQSFIVHGTELLFKGLRKYQFEVGQFIFTSSMCVHATCKAGQKIDENSPVIPRSNDSKAKILVEDLIHRMQGDIPSAILRVASLYDDRCHCPSLSHQIKRIYANRWYSHFSPGDPGQGSSFLHIDDLIEAIWLVMQKKIELPHDLVLILGEGEAYSYQRLQREIATSIYGVEWKTWSIPKWVFTGVVWCVKQLWFFKKTGLECRIIDDADDQYVLDTSRAKKFLGWRSKYSVFEYISIWVEQVKKDSLLWYRENGLQANNHESS